jgi:hypothetical protein
MAWSHDGLHLLVEARDFERKPVTQENSSEPPLSFELFIDTKNLKNARTTHRFCHHFLFHSERVEGVMAKEITRFRTEDTHALCSSEELEVKVKTKKDSHTMELFIPEKCLVGYQPEKGQSIGLSYCVKADDGRTQHFGAESMQMDFRPYLWTTGVFV